MENVLAGSVDRLAGFERWQADAEEGADGSLVSEAPFQIGRPCFDYSCGVSAVKRLVGDHTVESLVSQVGMSALGVVKNQA